MTHLGESPSHPIRLIEDKALACLRTRTSIRRPSSTVAFLVVRPEALMARESRMSSMSILVRMAPSMCMIGPIYTIDVHGKSAGCGRGRLRVTA